MKKVLLSAIILGTIITSCCIPCGKSSPKIGDLEQSTWSLIEMDNNPVENAPITLHFNAADKMVSGTAPCNNFFGGYHLLTPKKGSKQNIQFSNMGATMKYCPDMDFEQKFTRILSTITQVKIDGEHLMMINAGDSLMAVLVRAKM